MTDYEIVANYRNRANPPDVQIKILCELSGRNRQDILCVLHTAGETTKATGQTKKTKTKRKRSDDEWRKVAELKMAGFTAFEVQKITGVPESVVALLWRKKAKELGIAIPPGRVYGKKTIEKAEITAGKEKKKSPTSPKTIAPDWGYIETSVMASVDALESAESVLRKVDRADLDGFSSGEWDDYTE